MGAYKKQFETKSDGDYEVEAYSNSDDEFDGKLLSGAGDISITTEKKSKTLESAAKKAKKILQEIGIPMDMLGNLKIIIDDSRGRYPGDGIGIYNPVLHEIRIKAKELDEDCLLHELGHAIHYLYYPTWSYGDKGYGYEGAAYGKSPKEAYARRFAYLMMNQKNVSKAKVVDIIKQAKKYVDSNSYFRKPDLNYTKEIFDMIKEKKARWRYRMLDDHIVKVFEKKQIFGVKNGELITIAENQE